MARAGLIVGTVSIVLQWTTIAMCAEEKAAYFRIPFSLLEPIERIDAPERPSSGFVTDWRNIGCRVVLDGPGEAYFFTTETAGFGPAPVATAPETAAEVRQRVEARTLYLRQSPTDGEITGTIFGDRGTGSRTKFRVRADQASADAKLAFHLAKEDHFRRLLAARVPGGAWFRHQMHQAQLELSTIEGAPPTNDPAAERDRRNRARMFDPEFDSTYELFTGGRALSENLQLDRQLILQRREGESVAIDKLKGITIREIDWKPLLEGKSPKLDPLASMIPADQHVVFFPTFQSMTTVFDELDQQGTTFMQAAELRSEDIGLTARYQRQVGLKVTALGRLLGPQVIRSVAMTGGDAYLKTGSDVAFIFEAVDPATLGALFTAQIALNTAGEQGLERSQGEIGAVHYTALRTADRAVCSYLATIGGAVVVTNSPVQLERIAAAQQGLSPAVAKLDEYRFFRDRYRLGDAGESALLFISDATIRRWCSPRWRLIDSRRTRDAAVLAELQAANQADRFGKLASPKSLTSDLPLFFGGDLTLSASGIRSSKLGTLEFMTPIAELSLTEVTRAEADAYERWRTGYQNNFSWAFDPIALRISMVDDRISADLTVMPLIAQSEYAEMIAVSRGISLKPTSGDPHDTLAHFVLAINKDSDRMRQLSGIVNVFAPQLRIDPLSWLGESVSVYFDPSPFWEAARKVVAERGADEPTHRIVEKVLEDNGFRVPVALRIETSSTFKATAFVTALRAYIDQSAPATILWEPQDHNGQAYVKVSPSPQAAAPGSKESKFAVFYALTSDALTISLDDDVIKRVLDRHAERTTAATKTGVEQADASKPISPWLGENVALELNDQSMQLLGLLGSDDYRRAMQRESWDNTYILNEWRRLYPDEDPVALHRRLWGSTLTCPAGGKYVWNETWQTLESSVVGHPDDPKPGPLMPPQAVQFRKARFGLTFEPQGLRARAELQRAKHSE